MGRRTTQEMTARKRYWVRRLECWGGAYVWTIRDEQGHCSWRASVVGKIYQTERGAKMACERANADYERLLASA